MNRAPQSTRTYFLTFVAAGRRRLFQVYERAELLCDVLQHYRVQGKFRLHAYVVMPDHVHVLITPAEAIALERSIQLIKGGFSFRLKSKLNVWEKGHFGRRVEDADAYEACAQYIIDNPVRKRIVEVATDYPFSSASRLSTVDAKPEWFC